MLRARATEPNEFMTWASILNSEFQSYMGSVEHDRLLASLQADIGRLQRPEPVCAAYCPLVILCSYILFILHQVGLFLCSIFLGACESEDQYAQGWGQHFKHCM